jgi:small subunit ribosomal protein S8e
MGITREGRHKRRETGGRRAKFCKKRKYDMGRPAAMTKIGEPRIHTIRCRGGNSKFRALRIDSGNFAWGTEVCTRKVRVLDVMYNSTNNELVRTKTLVKGAIIMIDAHAFKSWYEGHYGVTIGVKKSASNIADAGKSIDLTDKSAQIQKKFKGRQVDREFCPELDAQFASGRVLAKVSSRPGQTGRCDGYILEGKELAFYQRMMQKK